MFEDLRNWPADHIINTDVCVVGAGAAGLVLARALAAHDINVVLVESGGLDEVDSTACLNDGVAVGLPYQYLSRGRARVLGGTTTRWAGQCLPLRPDDLARRSWVPYSGWPIGYEQLAPWLDAAAEIFAVDTRTSLSEVHRRRGLAPLKPIGDDCEPFATVYTPNLDLGRQYRADIERSSRIRCVLHATLVAMTRDRDQRQVEHVTISTPDGQRATVSAIAVVLCAGGIENARLLLATAGDGVAPGNGHDQVGRYLQDHPSAVTAELSSDDPRQLLSSFDLTSVDGLRYWPKLATTRQGEQRHQIAAASAALDISWGDADAVETARNIAERLRRGQSPAARDLGAAARRLPGLVAASYRDAGCMRGWPLARPRRVGLRVQIEQAPNPASRVTLGRQRDALGVPRVEVRWQLSDLDGRTFAQATRVFGQAFGDLGLATVDSALVDGVPAHVDEAYHPAGTTRMSHDERTGVVDPNLTVHGTTNLFVCGSSVFPTVGYANPTQTLCALALRLADHLAKAGSVVRPFITARATAAAAARRGSVGGT
jgi:choline dehydrogenase-like flavoprotein